MTAPVILSRADARRALLRAQGLAGPPAGPATKADVLGAIRRMHVLQIDTIHVVARSPYLVLWCRVGDYEPAWLDELLAEQALFESWSHAACFVPIEDFGLQRRRMLDSIARESRPARWPVRWARKNRSLVDRVRTHVREYGAVRSADFESDSKSPGGWWNWKEEKDALEAMWILGDVMVARRERFQRVYDLTERVLPDWDDADAPPLADVERTLALRAVGALGVACASWVHDYFRQYKTGIRERLEALADEALLHRVTIDGLDEPAYLRAEDVALLDEEGGPEVTMALSPFDPVVWDRDRANQLFRFDYKIECYTPAAQRRYGYFTLPILHKGALVGRLDPKAHRAQGLFEIKALHLEPGVVVDEALVTGLAGVLLRLAAWHGTPEVVVRRSDPPGAADALTDALRSAA